MKFFLLLIGFLSFMANSQEDTALIQSIKKFQQEENEFYRNKETSPLKKSERKAFEHHHFFPIDLDYVVTARFEKIQKVDTVIMGTSAGTEKMYQPFAMVYFEIEGNACELTVYQSLKLRENEAYKNYLFLPFRDATSGKTSYGGGRYLDLLIPEGDEVVLNFNLAYNPYCAYTDGYFCTIPPKNNTLGVEVRAGLMAPDDH